MGLDRLELAASSLRMDCQIIIRSFTTLTHIAILVLPLSLAGEDFYSLLIEVIFEVI